MKKIISVLILVSILVSFALVPVHAAENRGVNSPYCFYYDLEDSLNTYFGFQFFIEHTGQTFHKGYTSGVMYPSKTVPTNDYVYLNLCFGVVYRNNTAKFNTLVKDCGYLDGNKMYDEDMRYKNPLYFDETLVTRYVVGSMSLSEDKYDKPSYDQQPDMPHGYGSQLTGEIYAYSIRKSLQQIFDHGHDYLDEIN